LFTFLLFGVGAIVGSFLNVVICRTAQEESWMWGRSRCDVCLKNISWFDNIPLLSFILLRGKCRSCRKPIAVSHPVIELMTGMLFVWWYWVGFLFFQLSQRPFHTLQPLFWLAVGVLLLVIFFADLWYMIIPDLMVSLLLILVVIYRLILVISGIMQPTDLYMAVIGAFLVLLFFGSLWFATQGRGMGLGDVKLSLPMALLLGWPGSLVGVMLSMVLGASVGVVLLAMGKRKMGQVIPFGPFMVMATFITLLWGDSVVAWYLSLLR
jgi:leader peptidase (prepilin peptidase) / N-methyltransferase